MSFITGFDEMNKSHVDFSNKMIQFLTIKAKDIRHIMLSKFNNNTILDRVPVLIKGTSDR